MDAIDSIQAGAPEVFEPLGHILLKKHPDDDGVDNEDIMLKMIGHKRYASPNIFTHPNLDINNSIAPANDFDEPHQWMIRGVANGVEELYSRNKIVYWTNNSLIKKSFNFIEPVQKMFWAKFNGQDHVCIELTTCISIFDHNGQHFQVPLPFARHEMYAYNDGIIIERLSDPVKDSSFPTLFALTDPTHDISPILLSNQSECDASKVFLSSSPSDFSICVCHDTLPLCLIYVPQTNQHVISSVRKASQDELDAYVQLNEDSRCISFEQNSSYSFRESSSFNLSNRYRINLTQHSNPSPNKRANYSSKLDMRMMHNSHNSHTSLGSLAAGRLGTGISNSMNIPTLDNMTNNSQSFNSFHASLAGTPNKSRMINYLRDTIEEPIMPEIVLVRKSLNIFETKQKAQRFFSTTDFYGKESLVILSRNDDNYAMIMIEVKPNDQMIKEEDCSHHYIKDALPIPTMHMMLVIEPDNKLCIYSGTNRLTRVSVPSPAPTTGVQDIASSSPAATTRKRLNAVTPVRASSARKRSSLGTSRYSTGSDSSLNQILQSLSPVPHAQERSRASVKQYKVTEKIENIINNVAYVRNRDDIVVKRIHIPDLYETTAVRKLLDAIKYSVDRDLGLGLITSWYQTRRSSKQPEFMQAIDEIKLFRSWFFDRLDISTECFRDDTIHDQKGLAISPTKRPRRAKSINQNTSIIQSRLQKYIYTIFHHMHLVFEDMLLLKLNYTNAYPVAELLIVLACILKLKTYQDYYWLKFPSLQKYGEHRTNLEKMIPRVEAFEKPYQLSKANTPVISIMRFLSKMVALSDSNDIVREVVGDLSQYSYLPNVNDNSKTIVAICSEILAVDSQTTVLDVSDRSGAHYPQTINSLLRQNLNQGSHRSLERAVEMIVKQTRGKPYISALPDGLRLFIWDNILQLREKPRSNWTKNCYDLIDRMDLVNLVRGQNLNVTSRAKSTDHTERATVTAQTDAKDDSTDDGTLKLMFPDDIRVSEASRMLASDVPVEFSITQRQGATEDESREETLKHLSLLNVRTMAMPIGRGAMSLRTYSPVIGESFDMPRLDLRGRPLTEERPVEFAHDVSVYPWPFFHNGVAAGLKICASTANNIIDSTWINYNRPRSNVPSGPDIRDREFSQMSTNNEHAGFLFALGLNGHLEKLSLMALHDYLCQNNALTKLAILLGMSAAKRGTRDTNIIKVLSIHVDALLPPNSTELDVPAPVHAASILGVGLLYQNSGDGHISKVLLEEIGRLPGPETNSHADRESYSLCAGLAFGLVNLCRGGSSTISSSDQLRLYMLGGRRKPLTLAQRERYFKQDCHRGEEEYINTHVSSPGGTLGLGLMYHRSENRSVAEWMRAPDTLILLSNVRPDFLILRMLSYGLIMWSEVEPSEDWISSHIPKIVSAHAFQRHESSLQQTNSPVPTIAQEIDHELVSQAYCNIVAGCCMAMAIKYAGTANPQAYKTIYKHTKMMIALSNKPALGDQAGRPCIEACLNALVTSLAVIMAGTGDLGVMRICRYLRSRLTQNHVLYGSYMAIHMALGMLFLGNCRYSFSSSPDAVGVLICALYPIYPNHSSDNRFHLQALRHLYVLAAEPRLVIPRDIETNKPVHAWILIKTIQDERHDIKSGKGVLRLRAPCLVPEVTSIVSLSLDDDRFWRIEINDTPTLVRCLLKDQGYLSVKQKANSSNDQLVQNIHNYMLKQMPEGVLKSQKAAFLDECIRRDRLELFAVYNQILNTQRTIRPEHKNLWLEQVAFASLLLNGSHSNEPNSLRSYVSNIQAELADKNPALNEELFAYLAKKTDWTNTPTHVASYVILNNLCVDQGLEANGASWRKLNDIAQILREINLADA